MKDMKKYFYIGIAVLIICLFGQQANAQDGEQLFKAKCNTCHMVDKNSTGPNLKGVKQKWTDAGETEMLYEWVANSEALIASGKSKMANEIKGFSPTAMPPQVVKNEELDAILNYIDTYAPAPPTTSSADGTAVGAADPNANITFVPDYNENLTLFYWLFGSIVVLLIAIIILSTSITTLVKSDYFKKKLAEKTKEKGESSNPVTSILAIIGAFGAMAVETNSHALTFMAAGKAEKGTPWLIVENMDLYFMVVINVILLGVLFYLRRMFSDFMQMARPKAAEVLPETAIKKINVILTDAVAIEEEHTILMQHEYDGIRELDNNLPPWWVWGFFATIIFAVVYVFNYHIFQTSDLQTKEYDKELAQAKVDIKKYQTEHAMNVDETTATLLTDAGAISTGKTLFESNCVACHNPKAEGNIGPNLTDEYWIYGPDVKDLFKTIKLGTPNGMPEHASKLNPIQIQQVASFILSLPNTPGKAPDGKLFPVKK
jgi:cytochrome c oxidase cbb3-type subunit 3